MKKLISILLCLLLLLTVFVGCDEKKPTGTPTEKPTETPTETPSDTVSKKLPDQVIYRGETHKIERIDGTCYLSIYGYGAGDYKESHGFRIEPYVSFSSYYELWHALRTDGLSEEQLEQFKECVRPDEKGRMEIFEVTDLREPDLPLGAKVEEVQWYGDEVLYVIKAGSAQIFLRYMTQREYEMSYDEYITSIGSSAYVMSGDGVKYVVKKTIIEDKDSEMPYTYRMYSSADGIFVRILCYMPAPIDEEWLVQIKY